MKRILSYLLTIYLLLAVAILPVFAVTYITGTVNVTTPINGVTLKFAKKMGSGYKNAPTSPVIYKDTIIVLAGGRLYKLNNDDGKEIASVKTSGLNQYTTVTPCVADGKIFVQLDGGIIQAFDYNTLKPLWIYTDSLGGQALCNIVYSAGYIYTGFWNGEENDANYVCLTTKDDNTSSSNESKKATWKFKAKGGFYWSSACISGNYVILGHDNGLRDATSASSIVSLDKATGKKVSSLAVNGDIRSGVSYSKDTKRYYVTSKAGYLYSFLMDASTGSLSSKKTLALSGPTTATPVIYNSRLYIGCSDGSSGGRFYVIDASTLKTIYYGTLDGYPQSMPLLSTGYSNDGKVYIYITCNMKPGSIYMFSDAKGQNTISKSLLYSPSSEYSEFCISTISADSNGDLYYKNDSGTIFALKEKASSGASIFTDFFSRIVSLFKRIFSFLK